jgi:hypothetical protein
MAHSISFQYMEAGWEAPRAGHDVTDGEFEVPENGHVPRIGEFLQLVQLDSSNMYEVLAVHTRIISLPGQPAGWHSYITLGPIDDAKDMRLTMIRE